MKCDRCGACCRTFAVFAKESDAQREPRIRSRSLELEPWLKNDERTFKLYPLPFLNSCPFLGATCQCEIYDSRPDVCRRFEPGSAECQTARSAAGLAPLGHED